MTNCIRTEVATMTVVAIFMTCTHGLKIDFSSFPIHRPAFLTQKRDVMCEGNPCESSKPFLCKTSPKCIALKFVCDGTYDCDDGFDENPDVCNAAARPSIDDLLYFVENERKWMVPKLFNGASPQFVAHALSVASDMEDLKDQLLLTDQNVELLRRAFEGAIEGDERPLLEMGMPDRSWHEVQYVLQKLIDSGFKYQ